MACERFLLATSILQNCKDAPLFMVSKQHIAVFLTRPQECEIVKRYYVLFLAVTLCKVKNSPSSRKHPVFLLIKLFDERIIKQQKVSTSD
jgi:hypothetical protein